MTYRDDSEALRERVGELEDELAEANDKISRLTGQSAGQTSEPPGESMLLGAPTGVVHERALDYAIDEQGLEAIARVVGERLGVQVAQVGRELSTPRDLFSLRRDGPRTIIRLRGDWKSLRGGVIALPSLAAYFGGIATAGILHDAVHASAGSTLLLLAGIVPLTVGGVGYWARRRAQRAAQEKLRSHAGLMETILTISADHKMQPRVEARVAEPVESELESEIDARRKREA